MKKILFATTNNNKVSRIRNLLQDTPIKLLSLSDIDTTLAEPNENLNSCISIAAQKTLDYLDQIDKRFYVLTQDDTLQVLDVSPEDNPGASIKEPVVNTYGEFNDENVIKYYTSLVKKYAHPIDITFEYGHSLGSIDLTSEGRRMLSLYSSQSKLKARMVDTVKHLDLVPGCFLSAMMEVNINGEWVHFMDLSDEQKVLADADIKKSIIGLIDRLEIGR